MVMNACFYVLKNGHELWINHANSKIALPKSDNTLTDDTFNLVYKTGREKHY
jgi:hypothetical protein